MNDTTSKEQILKKIRTASMQLAPNQYSNIDLETDVYLPLNDDLDIIFAENINTNGGYFIYCENKIELENSFRELVENQKISTIFTTNKTIQNFLQTIKVNTESETTNFEKVNVSCSLCESLVARDGSILISSNENNGRKQNFISEIQIIIANRDQIVKSTKDALNILESKYNKNIPSFISFINGPSKTLEIEQKTIIGAHGPKKLIIFLTEDNFLN